MHFVYEWSGYWRPMALLAAVNESTWEHLKLSFWPGLLFALIEFGFIRREANNFWLAKCLGLLTMPVVVIVLFYAYTAILGDNSLPLDILVFALAVAAGQLVSYRLLRAPSAGSAARGLGAAGLVLLMLAFSLLTFYPPRMFLFRDPVTGGYGIPESHAHDEHSRWQGRFVT